MRNLSVSAILLVTLFAGPRAAPGEETARKALQKLLPEWKAAWNALDADRLYNLHHPDSRFRRGGDNDPKQRQDFADSLKEVVAQFGRIKSYTIGKYIQREKRFVVTIVYDKKGRVPGTFALRKNNAGKYLVFDFDIDGDDQPELEKSEPPPAAIDSSEDLENALAHARELATRGKYNAAITHYTNILRSYPKCAKALFGRGNAYEEKGRLENDHRQIEFALKDFSEAIRLDPNSAEAYYARAFARENFTQKNLEKAIADFTAAIRLDPEDPYKYLNRANAYSGKGDLNKARKDYSEANRLCPNLAESFRRRGDADLSAGFLDNAIWNYTELIRLAPEDAEAYFKRAVAYKRSGQKTKADQDFARAKKLGHSAHSLP